MISAENHRSALFGVIELLDVFAVMCQQVIIMNKKGAIKAPFLFNRNIYFPSKR
jgi:hypothetical protein